MMLGGETPKMLGVVNVEFFKHRIIHFGGICSGTEVNDSFNVGMILICPLEELVALYLVAVLFMEPILFFGFFGKVINKNQVVKT